MNEIHNTLNLFLCYLDDNSLEYNFDPHDAIMDFKEAIKKPAILKSVSKISKFNKFEMTMHTNAGSIIYDDLTGQIIYFESDGSCITVEMPITSSVQDIYMKMIKICENLKPSKK